MTQEQEQEPATIFVLTRMSKEADGGRVMEDKVQEEKFFFYSFSW